MSKSLKLGYMAVVCTAILSGCNEDNGASTSSDIRTGLYEYHMNLNVDGTFIQAKHQVKLAADHTMAVSTFADNTLVCEEKGKFEVKSDSLRLSERLKRCILDDGNFGPWEPDSPRPRPFRNITGTSFQIWWEARNGSDSTEGLESDWRTYNRIGDG